MIRFVNQTAEAALRTSHNSVSRFVMRLYSCLQPQVKRSLSRASSKVHISFDGWTTKGGKRGFFAVCTHYADAEGNIDDLPNALTTTVGAHTGLAIAETVTKVHQTNKQTTAPRNRQTNKTRAENFVCFGC
jgi:hypothetical protein